jgi:hypothetical protein
MCVYQHAISLIHHQVGNSLQISDPSFKVVDQSAWSGDHNLNSVLQVIDLSALGHSAIDASILDCM